MTLENVSVGTTCLFGDDEDSANERLHYGWLKQFYFPSNDFLIYPNLALQILIDADQPEIQNELASRSGPIELPNTPWSPENFLVTSCVDLCVIRKSDYVPIVVIEIDGESHDKPLQRLRDALKDSLLKLVGLPVIRLPVQIGQPEEDKQAQLSSALSPFKAESSRQRTRNIFLSSDIEQYFQLFGKIFSQGDILILPNVALTSIFHDDHIKRFALHAERNTCRTTLIEFVMFGSEDMHPKVAFTLSNDELIKRLFASFRLPLLQLRPIGDSANPT